LTQNHEGVPGYREAFPHINIAKAEAHNIAGRELCVFYTERGLPIGQAYLEAICRDSVTLVYFVQGPGLPLSEGERQLRIERFRAGIATRVNFRCPCCDARVAKLILKDDNWWCGTCHGLHYRSQLIDDQTAAAERAAHLETIIGQGRPRGMHRSTFGRLSAQRADAKTRMRAGAEASGAHRRIISATWLEPKDLPDGSPWLIDYVVLDNKMVRWRRNEA